jgi:hypothetical protein
MQATTCFHDGVPHTVLQETDFIFHDSVAFHATNGRCDPDADRCTPTIGCLCRGRQFPSRRFFLGLDNRDARQAESLEALLLIQAAPRWQGITCHLCQAFIRRFAFTGMTQEAHVTRLIDHDEVVKRVTRLLATVIFLRLLGIFGALNRAFGSIMPQRGAGAGPSVGCIASLAAKASAVRAGSSS